MDSKQPPDHSPVLAQTKAAKDDPLPWLERSWLERSWLECSWLECSWLERFLTRVGFFEHKYNVMYEPLTTLTLHYGPLILYCLGTCSALAYVLFYSVTSSVVDTVI